MPKKLQPPLDLSYVSLVLWIEPHLIFNGLVCVNDGAVVAPAEVKANSFQRGVGEFLRQVHGNLSGVHDLLLPRFCPDEILRYVEVITDCPLDRIDGDWRLDVTDDDLQDIPGEIHIDLSAFKGGAGKKTDETSLEFADIRGHVCGDELYDVAGKVDPVIFALFAENGDAGLKVGRLHVRGQSPLETGEEPVIQPLQLFWRAV